MSDWKPIETAPRDEKDVLVFCGDTGEMFVARHLDQDDPEEWHYAYIAEIRATVCCTPTHWVPLPAPPQTDVSESIEGQRV